jgi:hypothetical protein
MLKYVKRIFIILKIENDDENWKIIYKNFTGGYMFEDTKSDD